MGNDGSGVMITSTIFGPASQNVIAENTIAHNAVHGVSLDGATDRNTITENSIHANAEKGISLGAGTNEDIEPPAIEGKGLKAIEEIGSVITGGGGGGVGVFGTACANCVVEVFSDFEAQGRLFLGATTADGDGDWSLSGFLSGPNITATATDANGNTSEFSAPLALGMAGLWGDVDCDGSAAIGDALKLARYLLGLSVSQTSPCPFVGADTHVEGMLLSWGDADCDGSVAIGDAVKTARHLLDLSVSQEAGCPRIGDPVGIYMPKTGE
jgi:parallel beta-helix repeat protein